MTDRMPKATLRLVELRLEHRILRPLDEVEAKLLRADFAPRFAGRGGLLARGDVLALEERGGDMVRTAHFVVGGAVSVGMLGRYGSVGWRETVTWDRLRHAGVFTVEPDVPAVLLRRVRCGGTYELIPEWDNATRRVLVAQIDVAVPLVRREVEERIAALLRELFDEEAAFLGEP